MDVDAYVERLYAAFEAAPRPVSREIAPHSCWECDEIIARLGTHEARDVPAEDMHWLGDCLTLLGPKAFRYYLPRYIEFCLTTSDSNANGFINYNLAPSDSLDIGDRDRFKDFTAKERHVVLEFVKHRLEEEDGQFDAKHLEEAKAFWSASPNKSLERTREG